MKPQWLSLKLTPAEAVILAKHLRKKDGKQLPYALIQKVEDACGRAVDAEPRLFT